MVVDRETLTIGKELAPLSKRISQEIINDFEWAFERPHNFHDSEELARRAGLGSTVASGYMTVAHTHELMQRAFGDGWVHGGKLNLRFTRPAAPGDTITTRGRVRGIQRDGDRERVIVEVQCENQRGEMTAIGTASAFL